MANKMLLLAFSVLVIAKGTLGKIDCENLTVDPCERPEQIKTVPREVSGFNDYCVAIKSHFRCLKELQDDCGKDRFVYFDREDIYEATYDTLSEVCEEGTLLNTVATENLKCFNETFGKTHCIHEAEEFVAPFIKEEREGLEAKFSIYCMTIVLANECGLRAVSDNCGNLVAEAALDFVRRSKTLENACSVNGAKSILDQLDNLDLSEEKKRYITQLLERIGE